MLQRLWVRRAEARLNSSSVARAVQLLPLDPAVGDVSDALHCGALQITDAGRPNEKGPGQNDRGLLGVVVLPYWAEG